MKRVFIFLFLVILTFSQVLADTETNGTKIVELGTLPSAPSVGSVTILSFQAADTEIQLTHLDAYVTIKDAEGNILTDHYYIHTHGNQFSMTHKFTESGDYTISVEVVPSEHYEGTPFDPFTVDFSLRVKGEDNASQLYLYGFGIAITVIILGAVIFVRKKKSTKKHSDREHQHQSEN